MFFLLKRLRERGPDLMCRPLRAPPPVSERNPQEMDLLLPSTVLQGTLVFNKLKLHCPPRIIAVMQIFISRFSGSSSSIKRPVEISAQILPAVNSIQETGGKAYQYQVLQFSLALSPCTFTKCMDAALAPLRLQGIRILNYMDDWLILA